MDNSYFTVSSAIALGPLPAAFCLLLAVRAKRRRPGWTGGQAVTRLVGAVYAAGVLHFVNFPITLAFGEYRNEMPWQDQVQLIPLATADVRGFALNVLMLVPFGLLIPLLSAKGSSLLGVAGLAAAVSLAIEVTQLLIYVLFNDPRLVEVNDLIANTLGGVAGYLVFLLMSRASAMARVLRVLALPGSALTARDTREAVRSTAGQVPSTV